MPKIMRLCDRVTVLRDGAVAGETEVPKSFETAKQRHDLEALLVRLMIGRNRPEVPTRSTHVHPTALSVRKLSNGERFGPIDLDVRGGEIVAIVGVEGNGQSEFTELLIGLRKATAGGVALDSHDITDMTTKEHFRCGIAHIPEDRHRLAVTDGMSLIDNASIGLIDGAPFAPTPFWLSRRKRARFAASIVKRHNVCGSSVKAPVTKAPVTSLSGDNQQKLVVGRELARSPRLMIPAQSTRGLDIGSTAAVHEALIGLRDNGGAVLLLSLDLTEVFIIADRIGSWMSGVEQEALA